MTPGHERRVRTRDRTSSVATGDRLRRRERAANGVDAAKPPSGVAPSAWRNIQTEITKYTLDLLVREPDLDGFFRALLKTLAEEAESQACRRVAAQRRHSSAATSGWPTSAARS